MTQRPSGWYEDPDDPDQLRYWDGVLWSPRRTPKVMPGLERSGAGPRPEQQIPRQSPTGPAAQQQPWRSESSSSSSSPRRTPDGDLLAHWWQRVGALIIDYVLTSFVGALIAFPWAVQWARNYSDFIMKWGGSGPMPQIPDNVAHLPWQIIAAYVAVYAVYEIGMTVWRGQTIGKIACGIRVRRVSSAGSPDLGMAVNRFLIKCIYLLLGFVPALALLALMFAIADYLWPLRDPSSRALHDIGAKTYVVRTRGVPPRAPITRS